MKDDKSILESLFKNIMQIILLKNDRALEVFILSIEYP